jgi:hypothetical protein
MDQLLNVGFFVFHTTWIAFTCLGWIWRRTRPWQLALVLLTALSWFGLGAWYGWGYCPCTDWHWQARVRLGYDVPPSYTQLLIREMTGIRMDPIAANVLTLVTFVAAGVFGITLTIRDRSAIRKRPATRADEPER